MALETTPWLHENAWHFGAHALDYLEEDKLPPKLFRDLNTVVVRTPPNGGFADVVNKEVLPYAKKAWLLPKTDRFVLYAQMAQPIVMHDAGSAEWVKVAEHQFTEPIVATAEYLVDSVDDAREELKGIRHLKSSGGSEGHEYIIMAPAENPLNIKVVLKACATGVVVERAIRQGVANPLKLNKYWPKGKPVDPTPHWHRPS